MFNTVILLEGTATLTYSEYKRFKKGDTIYGNNSFPLELNRYSIDDIECAKNDFACYKSSYKEIGQLYYIKEYALEYCQCDENGEFVNGSDFDLAED